MFPVIRNTGLQTITRGIGRFPINSHPLDDRVHPQKYFFNFQLSTEQLKRYRDSESLLNEERNKDILEAAKIH